MSINDKSENFIYKTENNAPDLEEEKIIYKNITSNNFYLKTYNNINKKQKIKIVRNKTAPKLYKMKYHIQKKPLNQKSSYINPANSLLDNEQNYKDTLFLEVIRSQKNIKNINQKLNELKTNYKSLE